MVYRDCRGNRYFDCIGPSDGGGGGDRCTGTRELAREEEKVELVTHDAFCRAHGSA